VGEKRVAPLGARLGTLLLCGLLAPVVGLDHGDPVLALEEQRVRGRPDVESLFSSASKFGFSAGEAVQACNGDCAMIIFASEFESCGRLVVLRRRHLVDPLGKVHAPLQFWQ
jgi:hypothetical protein